jgi:hypothetical protein
MWGPEQRFVVWLGSGDDATYTKCATGGGTIQHNTSRPTIAASVCGPTLPCPACLRALALSSRRAGTTTGSAPRRACAASEPLCLMLTHPIPSDLASITDPNPLSPRPWGQRVAKCHIAYRRRGARAPLAGLWLVAGLTRSAPSPRTAARPAGHGQSFNLRVLSASTFSLSTPCRRFAIPGAACCNSRGDRRTSRGNRGAVDVSLPRLTLVTAAYPSS